MRALKTGIVVVLIALGFLGGFFVGWALNDAGVVRLSGGGDAAGEISALQERILEELDDRYYREVDADELKEGSIKGMLQALDDPYTAFLNADETQRLREQTEGEYSGIGAALEKKNGALVITRVFEGSPAAEAGLGPGDAIVSVDGESTADAAIETSISRIKGEAGTEVELEVRKKGEKTTAALTVTRRTIAIPQTETRMLLVDGTKVGYVQLYDFSEGAGDTVRENVEGLIDDGAEAVILDLRYNGGGLLSEAVDVSNVFLDGVVVSTKGRNSPLEVFEAQEEVETDVPLVVLVNEYTASASEIVAAAVQDRDRGTIVGKTTFGKGRVQAIVPLEDGASLRLTTAVYYTPAGRDINEKGVEPDVRAVDDPDTLRDEALQRALSIVGAD
ncbi:MAG: S41 family peptidase [Thermoleophilia bacterium]|nr:S41 family peptidase [Thermoleophilia bacterium]